MEGGRRYRSVLRARRHPALAPSPCRRASPLLSNPSAAEGGSDNEPRTSAQTLKQRSAASTMHCRHYKSTWGRGIASIRDQATTYLAWCRRQAFVRQLPARLCRRRGVNGGMLRDGMKTRTRKKSRAGCKALVTALANCTGVLAPSTARLNVISDAVHFCSCECVRTGGPVARPAVEDTPAALE